MRREFQRVSRDMSCCSHAPVGVIRLGDAIDGARRRGYGHFGLRRIRSHFSMHHDGVRLLFDDLESEPLIETQQRFAGYEAQADR